MERRVYELETAVKAVWSTRHQSRYSKVDVLLVRWEDDDLNVQTEIDDLGYIFEDQYRYEVEKYQIPSRQPDRALKVRVLDFLKENDSEDSLLIFYYAGHARRNPQSNGTPLWVANRQPTSARLAASGTQSLLEEADADVLLLYDCCHSAALPTAEPHIQSRGGVKEVLAACGFETIAPEVDQHSFTKALIETLALTSTHRKFSIPELHSQVLSRIMRWVPGLMKGSDGMFVKCANGLLAAEPQPRKTPIYSMLATTKTRRAIILEPLFPVPSLVGSCRISGSVDGMTFSPTITSLNRELSDRQPLTKKWESEPSEDKGNPHLLASIHLRNTHFDHQTWFEYFRLMPSEATDIKIVCGGGLSRLDVLRATAEIFDKALAALKQKVTPSDCLLFQSTTMADVWKAAEEIENYQRQIRSIRNMQRLQLLFGALEKYAKLLEELFNGAAYLPWVWGPFKLMIELANEHPSIFDKLLDSFGQMAEAFPCVDRMQGVFANDLDAAVILVMIYSDILEFHQLAYKSFRRRAWQLFFLASWKFFEPRFHGILSNITYNRQILNNETGKVDSASVIQWRSKNKDELDMREKKMFDRNLYDSISWLKAEQRPFGDEIEMLSYQRLQRTCEWVLANEMFQRWRENPESDPVLWIKGIIGAGKTVLSTYIIHQLQQDAQFTTAFYICSRDGPGRVVGDVLSALALQLLRDNPDLAPYIFEEYANKGLAPSISNLRKLVPELLATGTSVRFIVDGLDRYPETDQEAILFELLRISETPGCQFRLLFSSRESGSINRILNRSPRLTLSNLNLQRDIELYVQCRLKDFLHSFTDDAIKRLKIQMVAKANGMFLWVVLALQSLKYCYSVQELLHAWRSLPEGFHQIYSGILCQISQDKHERSFEKIIRTLQWATCSFRPLKVYEIRDAIQLHVEGAEINVLTKIRHDGFLDLCKPLIEQGPENNVELFHSSVKDYILSGAGGFNPLLQYHQMHRDLAYSCLNYMKSTICFIDPTFTEHQLKIRILRGFHDFHNYAQEFWFQHLLQYAKCEEQTESNVSENSEAHKDHEKLSQLVDEMLPFWKQPPGQGSRTLKYDPDFVYTMKRELESLKSRPQAENMLLDILTFKRFLAQDEYSKLDPSRFKKEELKRDPTYFSIINQRYETLFQSLARCSIDDLPEGTCSSDLERFKSTYKDHFLLDPEHDSASSITGLHPPYPQQQPPTVHPPRRQSHGRYPKTSFVDYPRTHKIVSVTRSLREIKYQRNPRRFSCPRAYTTRNSSKTTNRLRSRFLQQRKHFSQRHRDQKRTSLDGIL
ncbi:hypothetical protein BKA61DRAFT_585139 [Leptodontidium sp. MPI-SDFR-AT-0119]|nr:hypothetical protein BKA61DRAFT_585139 [Leptodontidium sp. MPI-SDFR-AT-0119]